MTQLRFGVADAYTGVDLATLSVRADFPVAGRPTGTTLSTFTDRHVWLEVADGEGNVTRVSRTFSVLGAVFADGFESGDVVAWSNPVP